MLIGERIKRIRNFREMTQKELGLALGFSESTASVRIAQYESNSKMPKKETAEAISKVLNCNSINFSTNTSLEAASSIMMDLFWLEESVGYSMYIFQLEKYNNPADSRVTYGMYNDCNFDVIYPPVAIALNYNLMNEFMREWAPRYRELKTKQITYDEYFEWKINWPASCDDGGRFEPSYQWRRKMPGAKKT